MRQRWWSDTLFKRLFVLMWAGLLVGHVAANLAVSAWAPDAPAQRPMAQRPEPPPGMGPPPEPGSIRIAPVSALPPGTPLDLRAGETGGRGPGPLPTAALWRDLAVRSLFIALFAWLGARWLAGPMARLSAASQRLGDAIEHRAPVPTVDEHSGTLEVRQTARVFNTMASNLQAQFTARHLFFAAVSHDLRTPLTRMRLRLEQLEPTPPVERSIRDIREMDTLLDDVLTLFRADQGTDNWQTVDITAMAQALVDDLVDTGHAASFRGAATPRRTDPQALQRIVDNLVENALKYAGSAEVELEDSAAGLSVCVKDRGPGIDPDKLDAVFQPFFRLAQGGHEGTGSGLGLHIAHELAERIGARLTLHNREGGGLCACLLLPPPDAGS